MSKKSFRISTSSSCHAFLFQDSINDLACNKRFVILFSFSLYFHGADTIIFIFHSNPFINSFIHFNTSDCFEFCIISVIAVHHNLILISLPSAKIKKSFRFFAMCSFDINLFFFILLFYTIFFFILL